VERLLGVIVAHSSARRTGKNTQIFQSILLRRRTACGGIIPALEGGDVSEEALTLFTRGYTADVVGFTSFGPVVDVGAYSDEMLDTALRLVAGASGVAKIVTLALRLE
jgi:hypothetical protein